MITAPEALKRLQEGNKRYINGTSQEGNVPTSERRLELAKGQAPFAIILGCSDSRVPAEFVFDQGLGDLFVIRVAGNIVAPSQIGSVEFAAAQFGARLVVVLGHSKCGAVLATIDELQRPTKNQSPHIRSLVNLVRPAVEPLLKPPLKNDREKLIQKAVRANVSHSVNQLQVESEILKGLIKNEGLVIVSAEYSLESGKVEFF